MRVGLLIIATIFALLFVYSFMPGLQAVTSRRMFWTGQAGLAVCLVVILTVIKRRKTR